MMSATEICESSPTCVINAVYYTLDYLALLSHRQTPELPKLLGSNDSSSDDYANRNRPSRKRVRIADEGTTSHRREVIPGIICTEEEVRELWLSKAELRGNCMAAKRDIAKVQQVDPEYLLAFSRSFQACSTNKATVSQLLLKDENVRCMIQGASTTRMYYGEGSISSTSDGCCIRGLEGKASHKALSQYRRLHVQNVLQVQQYQDACNNNCSNKATKWELLRSVSTKTSRTSRTLARLLGHMDEYQLNLLLQKELSAV
jgi:hypothetical protein